MGKYYVFLTADIHPIGGTQTYVEGKAEYLEQHGWNVKIFFGGVANGRCKISALNKYVSGGMLELGRVPEKWTKHIQKKVLKRMVNQISCNRENIQDREIIIESQDENFALWGELLAEKLNGKNICFICNERFRGDNKYYLDYAEFFDFKHKRKELAGICEDSLCKLFEGYKEVGLEERYCFSAANKGPVQNVESDIVKNLKKLDWNICYIGRASKPYVKKIIEDVARFSSIHRDKQVQFIMVGDAGCQRKVLEDELYNQMNVKVSLLGDMVPIPRELYQKIDVVIAGAGCAFCSAFEGVPVIVADASNFMANGILGYTTFNLIFHEKGVIQTSFNEALESVLVQQIQKYMKFDLQKIRNMSGMLESPEKVYDMHMKFIEESEPSYEYYHVQNVKVAVDYGMVFKYYMRKYIPGIVDVYKKFRG